MPKDMMERLTGSRAFLEGLFLTRQIAMAEFDMQIHEKRPKQKLNEVYKKIGSKYSALPLSSDSLFPASFGHIAHGYDAGYYSYLWSRVYAYECFNQFKKNGVMSSKIGKNYWKEIISQGSSRDEMRSLKAFLGKAPSVKAFINHLISSAHYD